VDALARPLILVHIAFGILQGNRNIGLIKVTPAVLFEHMSNMSYFLK